MQQPSIASTNCDHLEPSQLGEGRRPTEALLCVVQQLLVHSLHQYLIRPLMLCRPDGCAAFQEGRTGVLSGMIQLDRRHRTKAADTFSQLCQHGQSAGIAQVKIAVVVWCKLGVHRRIPHHYQRCAALCPGGKKINTIVRRIAVAVNPAHLYWAKEKPIAEHLVLDPQRLKHMGKLIHLKHLCLSRLNSF